MVLRVVDLQRAFDDLLSEARTREDISDWARSVRLENDAGRLTFEPAEMRDRLWRAVLYMEGVDLKDGPSSYLHVPDDFREYRARLGL